MKPLTPWSACLALFLTLTCCAVSYGQGDVRTPAGAPGGTVSVSYFYDALSADGQWFDDPANGWCWTPYDVSADWRPYNDGNWEYTDYGWSWASNEPFGWATYHYGRWFLDDTYGWAWVPATEWAPAWVAWRLSDDYVGWAPLPPAARWDDASGLAYTDAGTIPSDEWSFVPRENMFDASLSLQVSSVGRNVTLLAGSQDATRFEVRGGHPANVGIEIGLFEKRIGHPVARARIVDVDAPTRGDGRAAGSGNVGFFRPAFQASPAGHAPAPAMQQRRSPIPDVDMQRVRAQQQRKLESDLASEHTRLVRDQQNELRSPRASAAPAAIRQRQVVEQQAFDAHAAKQRQVLGQRMQKQVVRPGRGNSGGKQDNGRGADQGKGNH